ncbi:MAG: transposase [Leptolyngbya foveolarum]|uniref:Transposase n=1 Tax=Leptolyngbya foveolarum TaxID=47253 RepID=A0A2W4UQU4_9CYAN|nr:MAG: transposase [Leptolyngbya foveolarum]
MKARYQYRIYPTGNQAIQLSKLFGCCRVVWNDSLAWLHSKSEAEEQWPSNAELQKLCITLAKQYPQRAWLAEVATVPLQQSIQDLGVALKNFFEHRAKFPNFKRRHGKQSARFTSRSIRFDGEKLRLPLIGALKVKWSRALPSAPSSVTILRNKAGQYDASFVVEEQPASVRAKRKSVGVDLGIKTFAFLSTGEQVISPGYDRLNRKIARTNRKLSRQVKGSNRWQATKTKLARLHLKVANIRKDFLHKQSTKLIRENQTVSLENLNVKGMMANRCLSRAISQQGWSLFRSMCEAKVKTYKNRIVSIISRWEPTSQTCSDCGFRWGKVDLSVRSILCVSCGAEHDRDENAAKNIDQVGQELVRTAKTQTLSECQSSLEAVRDDASSQPYEATQLTLCF